MLFSNFIQKAYANETMSEDTEANRMKRAKKKSRKDDLLNRMSNAYKKNKRKEKIEKLTGDDSHWKGLS